MARAVSGGAAGLLRGSIGNTTYRITRHGQVVQSKPIPPVHNTERAVAAKRGFKAAMHIWKSIRDDHRFFYDALRAATAPLDVTPTQDWTAAYQRLIYDQGWHYPPTWNSQLQCIVQRHTQDIGSIIIHFVPESVRRDDRVAVLNIQDQDAAEPPIELETPTVTTNYEVRVRFTEAPSGGRLICWPISQATNPISYLGGSDIIAYS